MRFYSRRTPWVRLGFTFTLTLLVYLFLGMGTSRLPALGPLLNPFRGVWITETTEKLGESRIEIEDPNLKRMVVVAWDDYKIPHVFANKQSDLLFAQGYVTAQERLFAMDVQARAGAGRLSELFGRRTQSLDRFFVKMGMREAARRNLDHFKSNEQYLQWLQAYADGVNAYIRTLTSKTLPFEYRLLGLWPEPWSPERTMNVVKIMGFRLAGFSRDLQLNKILKDLGAEALNELFPVDVTETTKQDPIYNAEAKGGFTGGSAKPPIPDYVPFIHDMPEFFRPVASNGSNNWAVGPSKSVSGFPILANDTHLSYSLPAIWYEMQLSDVNSTTYGATIPGIPFVIIGFNRHVAWGTTNGYSDSLDWYEVEFRHPESELYFFEGDWLKARVENETIHVRGSQSEDVKILWTRQGPVVDMQGSLGLAARWVVHEPGEELITFDLLYRAADFEQCWKAFDFFFAPIQNFICADHEKIGIRHTGRLPKRWWGQGRVAMDGRTSKSDWGPWIGVNEMPLIKDGDKEGFVSSANQIAASADYPYYTGFDYEDPYRARRIREVLSSKEKFSPQDMMQLQNDDLDVFARDLLPNLLLLLDPKSLSAEEIVALEELKKWDYHWKAESIAATIFEEWYRNVEENVWSLRLGPRKTAAYPRRWHLQRLIQDQLEGRLSRTIDWLQPISGPRRNLGQMVTDDFKKSVASLRLQLGDRGGAWTRGAAKPTRFDHIGKIPGLGAEPLKIGGGRYTVNANRPDHGPTWKMVVHMTNPIEAWTNFPGGPSGDPLNPEYDKFLQSWAKGEMRPVHFMKADEIDRAPNRWMLLPKGYKP